MAGNFVNMRYGLGSVLGLQGEDPYNDLFSGKALNESLKYPTLAELKENFHSTAEVFQKLHEVTDEELDEIFEIGMNIPFIKETKLNFAECASAVKIISAADRSHAQDFRLSGNEI
jgi:hypothetical protein